MALVINDHNVDAYFDYLTPQNKAHEISLLNTPYVQLKRLAHLAVYGEYIDEKSICETLATQSQWEEHPKLAQLFNEASVRLGKSPPINLFESAKQKAREGGLSDHIDDYQLKARDLYCLAVILGEYHPDELRRNYPKYLINEDIAKRLIEDYLPKK